LEIFKYDSKCKSGITFIIRPYKVFPKEKSCMKKPYNMKKIDVSTSVGKISFFLISTNFNFLNVSKGWVES
jgi:hypothetical protein